MIRVAGSARRKFIFPARMAETFKYYRNLERSFAFLPHIRLVHSRTPGHYRLEYSNLELGLYTVKIYCDVACEVDEGEYAIRIAADPHGMAVKPRSGLYSMSCHGTYHSVTLFDAQGEQTLVDYRIELNAHLPLPFSMRWIPAGLMDGVAQNRFVMHTDEIIDSFVKRSIEAYRMAPG